MFTLKKSLLAATVLGLSIAIIPAAHAEGQTNLQDTVVAEVNGKKITQATLNGYLEILKKQNGNLDPQAALNDLIATEVALAEAEKTDILEREEIKKTLEDFKRNVLLQTWTREKVKSFNISDDDIKAAYDERVTKLASKEFNARHILVKTEDEAKQIIKDAMAEGADFAELAKAKSTGPSGSNGGSLGWFKAQTMVPAFANAVKAMKKGEISKEPVKTQFGYHVIKLEDSRDAKLPTLESLKPQLERAISQQKMMEYMKDLSKNADIKITLPEDSKETEAPSEEAPAATTN